MKRFPGEGTGVAALLQEPEVRREPELPDRREVPDEAAVDESGSVVLCGW
ncbi:hypothetical protein OHB24_24630 [Kribbella sp. NBC_00482]